MHAGLSRRLDRSGLRADEGVAERLRDARARDVRGVVVDLDAVDVGPGEGRVGEPAAGGGGDAATQIVLVHPVADLKPARAKPLVQPRTADDRAVEERAAHLVASG